MLFKKKAKADSLLSDEELVAELQHSMDADRFGLLYDRYVTKVYQKCIGMTRDKELAHDLTHDIFLKVFVNLSKFDHRSKFGTWVYSITYNYCLDHLRKAQRQRSTQVDDESMTEDIAEDTYESELLNLRSEHIDEVLAAMDPTDRTMLLMKYQEEHSVKEISELLNIGESAVKMRVLRARERALAKYYELYPEER
ncbi:MAG: RNA polymerase sigma factor [Flavobacteriales bacterium]|nr:RNA polymerase sigma factor [Flavobacteriales bacterium]MBK6945254.1 RNA polymerase sigma factor [Flavobacteriales bacterium]MBK7239604.1 RNA polymerase sigma factor [Flavobacteriales bacterium]MBK9535190.1 RNA polymerase sigma factor [Flavobacteriales bacterium]MBP9137834.1 RNA polymerase sigma factor [Flavobacteriales bacterium]